MIQVICLGGFILMVSSLNYVPRFPSPMTPLAPRPKAGRRVPNSSHAGEEAVGLLVRKQTAGRTALRHLWLAALKPR